MEGKYGKLLTALLKFIVIAPATTNVKTTINFKRYLIALFVLSPAKIWYCSIFFIDIINADEPYDPPASFC